MVPSRELAMQIVRVGQGLLPHEARGCVQQAIGGANIHRQVAACMTVVTAVQCQLAQTAFETGETMVEPSRSLTSASSAGMSSNVGRRDAGVPAVGASPRCCRVMWGL